MAKVEMRGVDGYIEMLNKLGNSYDSVMPRVINAGRNVVAAVLRRNPKFGKYAKPTAPKKNEYGWFAQVQFKGKTSSGASAGLAVSVNEFGRRGKRPQPARPWVRAAIAGAEGDAIRAMSDEYDKAVREIVGN